METSKLLAYGTGNWKSLLKFIRNRLVQLEGAGQAVSGDLGSGGRELPGTHRASEKCQPPESRAISEHLTQAHGLAASRKAGKQADMCWKTRSLASL